MYTQTDFLIIGAGIIGLTIARELQQKYPDKSILVIDKEDWVARHASGRNSGVLHAGLYYATDSLRAKFCVAGSRMLREYSKEHKIPLNECGKVVVAANEAETVQIEQLYRQAISNGVNCQLIDEKELAEIEPAAKTVGHAIYSPDTASFHALAICSELQRELALKGVKFQFKSSYQEHINGNCIRTDRGQIEYGTLVNCAGMYADKIAGDFGLIEDYTLIPFKGVFLYCNDLVGNYRRHIYPLPDSKIKLLGVHFSPEYDGKIKVGPTAVPCLARENYSWLENWRFNEMREVLHTEFKLFWSNKFNFRDLALAELKKQSKKGLIKYATNLVKDINQFEFTNWGTAGIQPRLYNLKKQEIMDDFLIECGLNSVHIINSVSPAFTASFAFSQHVVDNYL